MKKYPFIKQEGLKDCGPACLLMIIKYYRGYVPIEELRELSKTTKNGTDAYHLVECAKKVGFRVRGIRSKLNDKFILPVIAHVIIDNSYGHYVVIYEINFKRKYLIIGDPSKGIYKISIKDFLTIWDNVLIELIPERPIPKDSRISIINFLGCYIKEHKKIIISLFIASLITTFFSCLLSFYFRIMIDNINSSKSYLSFILTIFIIIYIFKIIMDYLKNRVFIYFKQNLDMNISCDIFNQIIGLPYRYYRNRTTGEIISRFDDLECVRQMLYRLIFSLFSDLPFILGSLILLLFINVNLTVLAIIFLCIYTLLFLILAPVFRKYISRIQEQGAIINSFMTESISGFETVKNCCLKEDVKDKFFDKYYKLIDVSGKFSSLINIRYILSESVYQIGILLILYFGSILVFDNDLSLGNLVMFYSILLSFMEPLKNIIEMDLNIGQAKSAMERMLNIFISNKDNGILDKLDGYDIKFKHLKFNYNDIDLVLDDINLDISSGDKVLILGKSGSGKSTLLKLIKGYYEASNNELFINNIDINNYKKEVIEEQIGYVSQQEILFTDSIINNLNCDNMKKVLKISKLCEIDNIMHARNLNLYSMIEENGFNLSGGERQRIILGRLLLKDFKVLLIDEGLNQMDINLERRILKRLFKKYPDKTIIIVSHRIDNMDLYDHVIELSNGKITKDVLKDA